MYKKIVIILAMCLFTSTAFSNTYEGGNFKVSWLRFGGGGVFVTLSPAPNGCEGGTQYGSHYKLSKSDESSYKDMVSGLLTAYTAGLEISGVWYRNEGTCSNSHVLEMYMFKYSPK